MTTGTNTPQPFVDHWPMRNEDLSKVTAVFDIADARLMLAWRFNTRLPNNVNVGELNIRFAPDRRRKRGYRYRPFEDRTFKK
jgi:hypothetical protein